MFRDEDGKSTDQQFYIEDMGSDTLGIMDRASGFAIAGAWTDNQDLADRIAFLLNAYGTKPTTLAIDK